jgi:CBS domain-containing protein
MGLRIEDIVVRKVVSVSSDSSAIDAIDLMEAQSTSCLIVIDGSKVDGILTSRDVIHRVVARGLNPREVTVREIASRPVIMLRPEARLSDAIKIMLQRKIKKIPLIVEDDGQGGLVGLVSLSDIVEFHSELFSTLWEQIIMMEPAVIVEDEFLVA